MNNFNHDQFYGMPDEINQVRCQKYFWQLRINFDIVDDNLILIKKCHLQINLENFPQKPELEKLIKEKCDRYVKSRRFSFLYSKAIAQNINYRILSL
jgi:hypothetical protein